MKIFSIIAIAYLLFCSCSNSSRNNKSDGELSFVQGQGSDKSPIEKFNWLIGTWKIITPEGQLFEVWTKNNDSLFTGNTCMIINNDTGFTEVISLKMIGKDLFYIPIITGQNQNKPVPFKLVSDIEGEFVFENNQHDFPQRIIYRNSKPDSLYARIEGNYNGEFRKEEFVMGREKAIVD